MIYKVEEFIKCRESFEYFVNNYFNEQQKDEARILHTLLFKQYTKSIIASNKLSQSVMMMENIVDMYNTLPDWMCSKIVRNTHTELSLENGSKILGVTINDYSLRGLSFQLIHVNEFGVSSQRLHDFDMCLMPLAASGRTEVIRRG